MSALAAATLGVSAGLGALGLGTSLWSNYKNMEAQADANAASIDLAKNAVKYRTEDLKNAGLNPLLAAGSAMSLPAIKAPQMDTDIVPRAMEGAAKASQIATTAAQNNLLNLQANKLRAETIGQEIQNKYAADIAGTKLEGMQLSNQFNTLANPQRLSQIASTLKGMDLDQVNKQLDSRLKQADIGIKEITKIRQEIGVKLDNLNVDARTKDILLKDMALRLGQQSMDWKSYENNWYQSRGFIPSYNPSPINRGTDILQNIMGWNKKPKGGN